jgi:hypothetical protein
MADNMLIDTLKAFIFGDKAEEWKASDEAHQSEMLEEAGLSDMTAEDLQEAVTLMYEELPPEQAAMLSPRSPMTDQGADTAVQTASQQANDALGFNENPVIVTGPEVSQNVEGDTTTAGGNVGDVTNQVSAPAPAPAAPAPAAPAPAAAAPAPAPVAPPAYEGDPAQVIQQTINYYVTNVDQSTHIENLDDRDTIIDNSTEIDGDIYAEGDVELDFDNDVQTAGDGAVQLGEHARIEDSQVASGEGAVAAGGDVDDVITGDVTDSTVLQDATVTDSNVTGDVEGVVASDSDVAGVNTGEVGGDMVTNTGDGNVATGGSEVTDVDVDAGVDGSADDVQVVVGDGNNTAQGEGAQAAGGDAIDAEGNVNTGAGDQTNLQIGDISSGDDLNLNLQGEQNVQDTETNTNIHQDNDTNIDQDNDTNIDTDLHIEDNDTTEDNSTNDSFNQDQSNNEDSNVDSEGAAVSDFGDALGAADDSEINIDEEFTQTQEVVLDADEPVHEALVEAHGEEVETAE